MKRKQTVLLAIALTILLAAFLTVCASAAAFGDVPEDAYYASAVAWALENGVTTGTSETTFSPAAACTRGQVVTFLWRASGCPDPADPVCPFADVEAGSYYEKAVLWAVEQGITNGTSATEFSPDALCISAHILTFLWRSLGEPEPGPNGTLPVTDPNAYYVLPWVWAANNAMLRDMADFSIETACSRAMTVTWLYRAMEWNPTVIQRQFIFDEGAVCGVYYAGGASSAEDREGFLKLLAERGVLDDFPFLADIPDRYVAATEGGEDLFLIIPRSAHAEITVSRWIVDESSDYQGAAGEILCQSKNGAPILLCCNVSDIMPDTVVSVAESADEGGGCVIFNPSVSLKHGRVSLQTITVLGDEIALGKFCDLTPYPADNTLAAPEGLRYEKDDSMLPDAGGLRVLWDAVAGAEDYVVKIYVRFPNDMVWTLAEHENPSEPGASWFGQSFYEIRVDVRAASDKGLGPVTSVILTEDELYPILLGREKT